MRRKTDWQRPGKSDFQYIRRESFTVDGTRLIVEDRINNRQPWSSERVLWIAGTSAYYSVVPICPAWNRLLCFTYCEDAMKMRGPGFYQHALTLGCGGGAVPRWLLGEYPDITVDVVDRSQKIIDICRKYFLNEWEDSDRLKYYCTDAKNYEPSEYRYQFIFCDLFNGKELAPLVYGGSFAERLKDMMSDDGILVVNCGWHHLREIKKEYQAVFRRLHVVDREPWQTEVIAVSNGPMDTSVFSSLVFDRLD